MALLRAIFFIALIASIWMPAMDAGAGQERKRVLFLSSYHPAFPTFFSQIDGVRAGLTEAGFAEDDFTLDLEFMDTKRFGETTQVPRFATYLGHRVAQLEPYDVVLAADDAAFRLATERQESMLRGSPVVFLGVNDVRAAEDQDNNPKVTGVIERTSVGATLQLIEYLYPLSGRVVVVSDATYIGELARRDIGAAKGLLKRLQVESYSLAEHTYGAFMNHLKTLGRDTPVLLLSVYRDKDGTTNEFGAVLRRIKQVYDGGLFVTQRHGLAFGALGGEVVDHYRQGLVAGRLAARILAGEPAAALPVVSQSPNVMLANYKEARRLGFQERDFPRGTQFIDRDISVFVRHGDLILMAVAIGIVQTGIIVMLFLNVRHRRAAESAANQARIEAEIANKAKTEFLANMSHELRTPLNSVIGFSDVLLADRVGAIDGEKRKEYLSDIRESGIYLLNLLNSILDVSKIEMGRLDIAEADVDVGQILNLCHRLVAERAAAAGLQLSLHIADDLPGLRADPTRLKQSVLNLLSNAIKFSDPGGSVRTSAAMDADGCMRISVRDTGLGIPAEELRWVLAPFNRGRSKRVASKEGSGIGLALTVSLMESHDGRLELDSEVDRGTAAALVFPARRVVIRRAARRIA